MYKIHDEYISKNILINYNIRKRIDIEINAHNNWIKLLNISCDEIYIELPQYKLWKNHTIRYIRHIKDELFFDLPRIPQNKLIFYRLIIMNIMDINFDINFDNTHANGRWMTNSDNIDIFLQNYINKNFQNYIYIGTNHYQLTGPQNYDKHSDNFKGYCLIWSLRFIHLYALNSNNIQPSIALIKQIYGLIMDESILPLNLQIRSYTTLLLTTKVTRSFVKSKNYSA